MLGARGYTPEYIDSCRARVESQLAAYTDVVSAAKANKSSLENFEAGFFSDMLLLLDYLFVHRLRTVEGKDGNPMNEVRMLCESLLDNNGILKVEKAIKWTPAKTVLRLEPGNEIRLTQTDFLALSKAYFAEVESRFSAGVPA